MQAASARQRTTKLPVDPNRIRHMPTQFAPIDRRLVYDRHIGRLTHPQLALYLFLQCVGDAAGLSYYSEERMGEYLHLSTGDLRDARQALIQRQFVLYRKPIYQLLDLPQPAALPTGPTSSHHGDGGRNRAVREAVSVGAVLRELCTKEFAP
jgi:hypothetical protein